MQEKLDGEGAVKGTMLKAHLAWLDERHPGAAARLAPKLGEESRRLLTSGVLATHWVPFRCIVEIDRAIAELAGGPLDEALLQMGRHSAVVNLGGVYKVFVTGEPHRFFTQMTLLHPRFQSFGSPVYERAGERAGRIRIDGCELYSPVYCASALGYYRGALEMMKVPGPIRAAETSCQCTGAGICLFELEW